MIELLEREHPEYRDRREMWQRHWDFYAGGEQLRRNASLYLVRRQKEPNDVYTERLNRVFYENYLGSCIDWYAATLFRSQPGISFRASVSGVEDFYTNFVGDCDCRGTSLADLARTVFIRTLVYREGYVLIDFPRVKDTVTNRAEEDALGKSRAYLVPYTPQQLTNWKTDENGDFEWVVLRTERVFQEGFDDSAIVRERVWAVYDRERFRIFSHKRRTSAGASGAAAAPAGTEAKLVDEGRHGLAEIGRVPLVKMAVSDGLWLANKGALLQQEHFNKANALSWALHMGLFAMPVIYSEREWQ